MQHREYAQAGDEVQTQDIFGSATRGPNESNVLDGVYENPRSGSVFSQRLQSSAKLLDSPRRPRRPGRPKLGGNTSRVIDIDAEPLADEDGGEEQLLSSSITVPANSPTRIHDDYEMGDRPPSPVLQLPIRPPPGTFKIKPTRTIRSKPSRLPVRSGSVAVRKTSRIPVQTVTMSAARISGAEETLDSELRRADESFGSDLVDEEHDSNVLSAVGTRSQKQGFLAHGGAGGLPVMMGPGHVEGLGDQSDSEDESRFETDPARLEYIRRLAHGS